MTTKSRTEPVESASPRAVIWAGAGLAAAVAAVYSGVYSVPFLFDDKPAILTANPSIRTLWPIWVPFNPPHAFGQTVGGRPLPNFTLALNHAISGVQPWSYHAANVLIHIAVTLVLFGLVRRTLQSLGRVNPPGGKLAPELASASLPVAFFAALLWAVHPLATEAVTYVVQRVESLMALFYLLTLYCFLRSTQSARPRAWLWASGIACLLGMASKEVMATAPVAVLLFDRWCVTGSVVRSLRTRGTYYSGLAFTWVLLAFLVATTEGRGGTAGFGGPAHPGSHILTQIYAVAHYLRLAVWPSGLVFEYGPTWIADPWSVLPQGLLLGVLLGLTLWGLFRQTSWGYPAALCFLILSPSTLIPIPVQTMAEHRMYLPLAALSAVVVAVAFVRLGKGAYGIAAAAAAALGVATMERNREYRSEVALWTATAANHPMGSARADYNAGGLLAGNGEVTRAMDAMRRAIALEPRFALAYDALGTLWLNRSRPEVALRFYRKAIDLDPTEIEPLMHAGTYLEQVGQEPEAIADLQAALRLDPKRAEARLELGNALFRSGRYDDSLVQYEAAEREGRLSADVANNIGSIWFERREVDRAIRYFRLALGLGRDSADTRVNLANALAVTGHFDEAAEQYRAALKLDPSDREARENLARVEEARRGSFR